KTDGAVVTEPTEMNICLAHKGFVWLQVEIVGRAAHGSRFDQGIDANMRMGRFIAELDKLEQELRQRRGHPLTGTPSLHAAIISGGTALTAYAARCRLQIERRTISGESDAQVVSEIQDILNRLASEDATFQGTVKSLLSRQPSEITSETELVRILSQASMGVLGHHPKYIGVAYWMDTALLSAAGIETVTIGPIGAGAHAEIEWVEIQSLIDLAEILIATSVDYCQ
ncbi:MAG: peptidase dimerization domain-containing protein, partial [Anaerolineales bacterium]|nr:peptidase dimerization domain-containing protein [Anaerolineales bacterium]